MDEFKKIIFPILGVIIFLVSLGLYERKTGFFFNPGKTTDREITETKITEIKINNLPLKVEVARTAEERKRGLSNRKSLASDRGMLFVFEKKGIVPVFWMKEMNFSVDIIWIKDNLISGIIKNIPPPQENTSDKDLPTYHPENPIDYALETISGFAEANKLEIGQLVDLSSI